MPVVRPVRLPAGLPRANLGRTTHGRARVSTSRGRQGCEATSGAEGSRAAESSSSMWAWPQRSAAQSAASASGWRESPEPPVRSVVGSCSRPRSAAARRKPALPPARSASLPRRTVTRREGGRGAHLCGAESHHCEGVSAEGSGCRRSKAPSDSPPMPATRCTSRAISCRPWDRCSSIK